MLKNILLLESLLLVSALSLDTFVASIGYGTNKIKIPFLSAIIINFICSSFLALSLYCGSVIKKFLPGKTSFILGSTILIFLGVYYLFEGIIKAYFSKNPYPDKKVKFKLFSLRIIIDIYVDETKADFNNSKDINSKEALYLAIALSLDSLATGIGGSLGGINILQVIILSFVCGMLALCGGIFIGKKLAQRSKINLSWLSGIILILLAIMRLI